ILWPAIWGFFGATDPLPPVPQIDFPAGLTFHENASLAQAMPDAGPGMKWVGYVSEALPMLLTGELVVDADFGLPAPAGGGPYAGPFPYEVKSGVRLAVSRTDVESLALALDAFDLGPLEDGLLELL